MSDGDRGADSRTDRVDAAGNRAGARDDDARADGGSRAGRDGGSPGDARAGGGRGDGGQPLLRVEGLRTRFPVERTQLAVDGASFSVYDGEVFGLVGESGSGKTVTGLSVIDLLESPGEVTDGAVWFRDPDLADDLRGDRPGAVDGDMVDLRQVEERTRRSLRGPSLGMIFQDPMTSLNPSLTVGEQIAEAVEAQRRASANPRSTRSRTQGYGLGRLVLDSLLPSRGYVRGESLDRAVELLADVGIPDPADRARQYPHEFSGGMLQRAMIAQALAGEPDLLIADEPTTGLDVTIQAQILNLLEDLSREEELSVVLITHDLGVIAHAADAVGVMYAGQVVERGTLPDIFDSPVHPYTRGLLGSVPDVDDPKDRLDPIEGNVPELVEGRTPEGCYFADRCPKAMERCLSPVEERAVTDRAGARPRAADGGAGDGRGGRGGDASPVGGGDDGDGAGRGEGADDEGLGRRVHRARCVLADGEYRPAAALSPERRPTFGAGPGTDTAAEAGSGTGASPAVGAGTGTGTDGDDAADDDADGDGGERS